jgi:hypothetical protein
MAAILGDGWEPVPQAGPGLLLPMPDGSAAAPAWATSLPDAAVAAITALPAWRTDPWGVADLLTSAQSALRGRTAVTVLRESASALGDVMALLDRAYA